VSSGADNAASLRLHAAHGFQEVKRFDSDRSPAGVDVLAQLVKERGQLWARTAGSPAALASSVFRVLLGSSWTNGGERSYLDDTARGETQPESQSQLA
jgi:hypothetical protein